MFLLCLHIHLHIKPLKILTTLYQSRPFTNKLNVRKYPLILLLIKNIVDNIFYFCQSIPPKPNTVDLLQFLKFLKTYILLYISVCIPPGQERKEGKELHNNQMSLRQNKAERSPECTSLTIITALGVLSNLCNQQSDFQSGV